MQIKKQQLVPNIEQPTGPMLGKKYVKVVCCPPAYLTYLQSTSWEILGWRKAQAGIKIAGRNINNLRYADDTTRMAESEEELEFYNFIYLFNLYAEYIMRNTGLEEAQSCNQDCREKYQ